MSSSFIERYRRGPLELTTSRSVLRPLEPADEERLHQLWSSLGVRRFLWDDEVIPPARTRAAIDQSQRMFAELSYGLWGVWAHDSPELVGFCGLWPFRDPPELELVYGIEEQRWGRGYAVEVADAIVRYAFESLEMPVVRASTDEANTASVRVLEKLGFAPVRRDTIAGLDTVFFERQRPPG